MVQNNQQVAGKHQMGGARARPPFDGLRLIFDCFVPFLICFGPFLIFFSDFCKFLIKLILRLFNGCFGQRPLVGEADLGSQSLKPITKLFLSVKHNRPANHPDIVLDKWFQSVADESIMSERMPLGEACKYIELEKLSSQ